ncbi:MAG: hypothetical protein QW240_04800, partial [Candidatus Caldarchaeum sp.]
EESLHTYSVDGEEFYRVSRVSEIPAEAGDELYVDVIPVELTDDFIEVLRRGVRVFYLRRLTLFKQMYERLGIKTKNAKNDVRVLMALECKWFREVDEGFLIMRRLVSDFRSLLKSYVSLTNRMRASSGVGRDILKDAVKSLEEQMNTVANIIDDEAGRRIPAYNRVVDVLGIAGDSYLITREALAEVMTYIDPRKNFIKTANYFGLFKGKPRIFNRKARRALERLTLATKITITAKEQKKLLYTVWRTMRETHERLEAIPA